MLRNSDNRVAALCVVGVALMAGLSYAAVPLYRLYDRRHCLVDAADTARAAGALPTRAWPKPSAVPGRSSGGTQKRAAGVTEYIVKITVTAALVVLISEIGKRSSVAGALLASLPIVSILAMLWLYSDTRDAAQVAALARSIFWLVLPSLLLFLVLPMLLERGFNFYVSLSVAAAVTIAGYFVTLALARYFGVQP